MPKSILTNEQKNRVYQLTEDGFSQTKIAQLYGVSQGTISNALKEQRYQREIQIRDAMMQNAVTNGTQAFLENRMMKQNPMGYIEE